MISLGASYDKDEARNSEKGAGAKGSAFQVSLCGHFKIQPHFLSCVAYWYFCAALSAEEVAKRHLVLYSR